jgi:calcium-dependent protein kinase
MEPKTPKAAETDKSPLPKKSKTIAQGNDRKFTRGSSISLDLAKLIAERKGALAQRYNIYETIGKGGYGEVKKVQDMFTNALYAMKVIQKRKLGIVNLVTLNNEVEILKKLDHPNILKLCEFAQDDDNYYLITELCTGGELFERLIKSKNFTESVAAQIMKSVLSAVAFCHTLNIVHRYASILRIFIRDLKPENLLFETKEEDSAIKVIDFGTSMIFNKECMMNQALGTVTKFYLIC